MTAQKQIFNQTINKCNDLGISTVNNLLCIEHVKRTHLIILFEGHLHKLKT